MNPKRLDDIGWKNHKDAFEEAIKEGRLSEDKNAWNWAGHYMYMGPTMDGKADAFKHIDTRQYLPLVAINPGMCS
jgi:hypothetical protein